MCAGMLCMVGLDIVAKWLLQNYSLSQLVVLRCSFSVILIFWFATARDGLSSIQSARPGWHLVRSLLMAGSMFAFFHALRRLPLAEVLTIAFAAPLIVTALSRPVLGEYVGRWRWVSVLVGFCGVLIVLRPGSGLIQPAALIALFGAAMYAVLSLTSRRLSQTESTASLSLYIFGIPWLIGAAGSFGDWIAPGAIDWLLFALCGTFGGLAFVFINSAYRRAPAAAIVPFEYTGLIWAGAGGFLIWGEVPASTTWLGAAIIIASGLFIIYRETMILRRTESQLGIRVDAAKD